MCNDSHSYELSIQNAFCRCQSPARYELFARVGNPDPRLQSLTLCKLRHGR